MKIQQFLTTHTLIAVCLLLWCTEAKAQRENQNSAELIKKLDKNRDGVLSKEELPEGGWNRLSRLDKNRDGKITSEEVNMMRSGTMGEQRAGPGNAPSADQRAQFFARLDKNSDGKLTESEVPETFWERLSKADQNGDNSVSRREMEVASQILQSRQRGGNGSPGGVSGVMTGFDEDGDGKLGQNEVSAGMWAKISKLDSDEDGSVSRSELAKAYGEKE